ncbi:GntR family transcriptional regulator [Nocardia sp. NPDC059246]|uniref:GntR family transcriptional regulator n=1 Tax=unclassified Nocardia TaxID=2637762 RepID=UPI0036B3D394
MTTWQSANEVAHARLAEQRSTLERTSTSERVAELVRQTIVDGTFRPGTHLSEPEICTALGVSRNTLREAFRYLAKDRLVTHELNRGVFVRLPTLDDIRELYRCRRLVECAAVRGFNGSAEALTPVHEALTMAREKSNEGDWIATGTADIHFHRALTALAGSTRIDELMEVTFAELRLVFLTMGDPQPFHEPYIERNCEIAAHLRAGRTEEAERKLRHYLVEAEHEIFAAYQQTQNSVELKYTL